VVRLRGRLGTVSARVARPALLCGPSTSPLERTMHALRLLVLTVLLLGIPALMARSVAHSLRTGTVTLRGGRTCRRAARPLCFWASMLVTMAAGGFLIATWVYVMVLQQHSA